jgi:hypothetical protein
MLILSALAEKPLNEGNTYVRCWIAMAQDPVMT